MRLIKFLILLLVVTLLNCTENTSPEEDYIIYEVIKIDDRDIEEFKEIHSRSVYPIEFRLFDPVEDFKGRVVFENLGLKNLKIFGEGIIEDIFYVEINYEIEGVENVIFQEIEIDSSTIKGVYYLSGPTIDSRPSDFLAIKK
jgi:hypothetical protein